MRRFKAQGFEVENQAADSRFKNSVKAKEFLMLKNLVSVRVAGEKVVKTDKVYAAPQLVVVGKARDLVQGGWRGGYWDGRNGRTYWQRY
jgi:hypothetical protein